MTGLGRDSYAGRHPIPYRRLHRPRPPGARNLSALHYLWGWPIVVWVAAALVWRWIRDSGVVR